MQKYNEIIKKIVLLIGLIFFLNSIYLDRFDVSVVIIFSTIISWLTLGYFWDITRNFKEVSNIIFFIGIITSFAIFINFGIEQTAFPIGGFLLQSDGIFKAFLVLFLLLIVGFLFRYLHELEPRARDEDISEAISQKEDPLFESDDWELVSEDEIMIDDYEIIND
tara:strand:- start:3610 stop:4104 length:495 start_codon:yes stop_codon:yes gene_type:complete